MEEVLVHTWNNEPCDEGLAPYEDHVCLHGIRVHYEWARDAAA